MLMCVLLLCSAEPDLTRLVERLQSDDFDTREAATKALMRLPRAEGILEKAAKDGDADLKKRIETIVRDLARQRAERAIRRGTLLLTSGRADLHPDLMRTFQERDPKHLLHGAFVLMMADLSTREKALAGKGRYKPQGHVFPLGGAAGYHRFGSPVPYHFRHIKGGFFQQTRGIVEVLICSGDAHTREKLQDTIVLCDTLAYPDSPQRLHDLVAIVNGPLRAGACADSIVICDEMLGMWAGDSICIARRSIHLKRRTGDRKIEAGDPVYNPSDRSSFHVPAPGKRSFGLIRFFEVRDVGLTLDACKVTKVTGPLAKAGVKSGDMFTHVDGVAVKDAEALRKALRRRYAILGYGAFSLLREGKPLTVVAELDE